MLLALDPYTVIAKDSPIVDAQRGSTFEIRCDVNNRPDGRSVRFCITTNSNILYFIDMH